MRAAVQVRESQAPVETFSGFSAALAAVVLSALLPVLIISLASPAPDLPYEWAALVMVWSGFRLAWLIGRGRPHLYGAMTWTFVYVWLGMAPLIQMRAGLLPDTTPAVNSAAYPTALLVVGLGILGLEFGFYLGNRVGAGTRFDRRLSEPRVRMLAAISVLVVGYATFRTGFEPLFESRTALGAARNNAFPNPSVAALVLGATLALPLVSFHALVLLRRQQRVKGLRPSLLLTTIAVGTVLLATTNVISGSRIHFGTVLLSLAVLFGALKTQRRFRSTVAAVLLGMIFAFPAADIFRNHSSDAGFSGGATGLNAMATSGDFDAFSQTANAIGYVEANGTTGGMQAVGVALFWVPRSIWPSKPQDTGVIVAEWAGYRFHNLSAPLWAEAYVNGGLLAVPIFLAVFGYVVQRADRRLTVDLRTGGMATIAGAILPFYLLIVLRGSLLQATGALVVLLLALWAVSERRS